MRPLSEVFAPGAPTLPERLRTLVVSPERELEPGMTVRATFTFRNHGGAPATGVQIRFNLPDGLVYLVGTGLLDGSELDDELGNSPLLGRTGAHVGDVLPNEERRIEIAYSVAGAIENGTTVELQAAVASFELPSIGSNVVRLVARSKPQLANALTGIALESVRDAVPGSQAAVTVRIHNAGESTARDVVVVSPIPEHTSYVAGSARVNGREIERELGTPFDRLHAPVVLRSLPARASATLMYRVAIDAPLPGGTQLVARAEVASQETPAFSLEPASLTVVSAPDFNDERTAFSADPAHDVQPGQRVRFALTAFNAGTAAAERVSARLQLSDHLIFVRGAATIDGRPLRERRKEPLRFQLGTIDAGQCVTLCAEGVLTSPLPDKTFVSAAAVLDWEAPPAASRRLECDLQVRSEPSFPPRCNALARAGSAFAVPGSALEASIVLANEGSADAHDGVLHVRIEPALDDVAVFESGGRLALEGRSADSPPDTAELGTIEAYATRRLTVKARVPSPFANASELRIGASLHTRELGETHLPEARWRVDSHPAFDRETSRLELSGQSVLRPNQLADVDVVVTNVGTDTAHNVTLRCYISPEARLESVDGATREKSSLLFGELAPAAHVRARLGLRLLRGLAKDWPVTVDGLLTADGVLPVPLERLTIATSAEADFSTGNLHSEPADAVDPGETVEWFLHVRNGGDGTARVAEIAIASPESLIYVPNSTTVNDVPIRDSGALPPFAGARGIVLNDVDPGVEATIRWCSVVHNASPAGTSIAPVAHIRYDGERDDEIVSAELRVRATPIFANAIPGLPFGLDGMLGPSLATHQRALPEERFLQLPPATPVGDVNGAHPFAQLSAGRDDDLEDLQVDVFEAARNDATGTIAAFTPERLNRTLRLLREARFGGLITHVFALRAFLPEGIGDAHCRALEHARELLREELDRLFIKLRLPLYALTARDIETPSLHSTLERLMREAGSARGVPAESPTAALTLRGAFDPTELRELGERMAQAQLATALPWAALARLLPAETPAWADYRALLIEALDDLGDSDCNEFIEALQHRSDKRLDAALDAMVASLHSMV
ncbi:MAG: hypothetical protein ABSF08_04060 [Candidatus Cybelea sp.]